MEGVAEVGEVAAVGLRTMEKYYTIFIVVENGICVST